MPMHRPLFRPAGNRFPKFHSPFFLHATLALCLILILSSGLQASASHAPSSQPAYASRLEAFLLEQMERYHIPGLAIGIVREGEIEYLRGLGVANPAGDPVTPDTPFLLASVSKSITALGVMQLIETGQLSLDDPIQKHLPWFAVSGGDASQITVARLLYQTSGLTTIAGVQANLRPDTPDALEAGVRALSGENLAFAPGESWEYSNLNYNVLGLLIQAVSGQPYEDYITERIFTPLEMANSHTHLEDARAGGASSGYIPFFGYPLRYDRFMPYTRATLPSAGLWSSAADLSHYLIAQLNQGKFGAASVLSPAGVEAMHTPGYMFYEEQGYGMGWTRQKGFMPAEQLGPTGSSLIDAGPLNLLFHEGDWANYKSMAFMIPELDYGVILLMNSNDFTVPSAFRFFAWDVTLIATGGEPQYFPPAETFLVRNSRWIAGLLVVLFFAAWVWARGTSRKMRQEPVSRPAARRSAALAALLILLNAALLAYAFFKFLPDNNSNLIDLIRFVPDVGLLFSLLLLVSAALALACISLISKARQPR